MKHLPSLLRRRTSILQRLIQDRRSFKDISASAHTLDLLLHSSVLPSSADAIASFFLKKQQEAVETHLREQKQLLLRLGCPHLIDLLRFSAYCSWRASLLCASLFKDIVDAKRSISRIRGILGSPSGHSQVGDLLLALADLRDVFSEEKLVRIRLAKDLLAELDHDLKSYQAKIRVRALSGLSTAKHMTRGGMLSLKSVARHLQAIVRSKLSMCITAMGNHVSYKDELSGDDMGPDDNMGADDSVAQYAYINKSALLHSGLPYSPHSQCCQSKVGLSCMHKIHMRLYQIETSMRAVSLTLDTLMPLVSCTHDQGISQHLIEILRDDPLMFDGVAAQIIESNAGLSKHLEAVREQVLICFCYVNNARDQGYAI